MKTLKTHIRVLTILLILSAGTVSAFGGDDYAISYTPSQAQIIQDTNLTLLTTFSTNYDLAFRKTLDEKHPFFSLYYRDLSTNATSFYMISEAERNMEAKQMARQALYAALQNTVNDVNVLYTIKEYGRSMTSANMSVRDGKMNIDGPTLKNVGNHDDPSPQETLRSSLRLLNNADFGLTFQTSIGQLQTNVTYFVAGRDMLGASISRDIYKDTSLVLDYRMASNENQTLLTLKLPFQF
jgi:hypothetical protein